jgi:hypothetical protein
MKILRFLIVAALFVGRLAAQTVVSGVTYNDGDELTVFDGNSIGTGSTVLISPGANITFQTPGSITLMPGFHATPDSYFHAYIMGVQNDGSQTAQAVNYYGYNQYSTADLVSDGNNDGLSANAYQYVSTHQLITALVTAQFPSGYNLVIFLPGYSNPYFGVYVANSPNTANWTNVGNSWLLFSLSTP